MSDPDALHAWKQLTERILPARAAAEGWPVRLDHCFKRITLDCAFRDLWFAISPAPRSATSPAFPSVAPSPAPT